MPQLDFSLYISQIFWFAISFGGLFVFMRTFVMHKIADLSNLRSSQYSNMSAQISDAKVRAKAILAEIEAIHAQCQEICDSTISRMSYELRAIRKQNEEIFLNEYRLELRSAIDEIKIYSREISVFSKDISKQFQNKIQSSRYSEFMKHNTIIEKSDARLS